MRYRPIQNDKSRIPINLLVFPNGASVSHAIATKPHMTLHFAKQSPDWTCINPSFTSLSFHFPSEHKSAITHKSSFPSALGLLDVSDGGRRVAMLRIYRCHPYTNPSCRHTHTLLCKCGEM